jgi:ATPase subunit of ABC transporter with duplicated ATPase domains
MKVFTIHTVVSCILTYSTHGFGIIDSTSSTYNSLLSYSLNKTTLVPYYSKQVINSSSGRRSSSNLFSTALNKQQQQEGIVVGDTKGAALYIEDVCISRGSNRILSNVNLRVERGQRWGIVGPNGVGKSTLLGALTGTVRMDQGCAMVAPKIDVGYLRQTAVAGSTKTVFEEASSEMKKIQEARARMEEAERAITEGDTSDEMLLKLDEATSDFAAAGGWNQEQTVANVLKGLGFKPEDMDRLCSEFSGGWQMRIGLARLLLSNPSLLLLDEPSNHLDSSARDWLGKYLKNFDGSLVLE